MATAFLLDPFIQIQDNNGLTVPGAKVYVYNADTTVPAVTYSDFQGHANTSPVVADSLGHVSVIAELGYAYDVVINYPDDTLLMSEKGILPCGGSGGGSESVREILYVTLDNTFEELDSAYKAGKELILRTGVGLVENYRLVWATNGSYSFALMPYNFSYEGADPAAVGWCVRACSALGWSVSYSTDDWKLATKKYVDKYKQNTLTEGANIEIADDIISVVGLSAVATSGSYNDLTDRPTIEGGTDIYTVSGGAYGPVESRVSAAKIYTQSGNVSLDGDSVGSLLPVTDPNCMLLSNSYGSPVWTAFGPTGYDTQPVFINSDREFEACKMVYYIGSSRTLRMKDSFTLDGTANEQTWPIRSLYSWPYGFMPYMITYNAVLNVPVDMTVRFYELPFLYAAGEFTQTDKMLLWVGHLKAGSKVPLNIVAKTMGLGNNTYMDGCRITVQPDTASSGTVSIVSGCEAGDIHTMPYGFSLGNIPGENPQTHWVDPT